MISGLHDSPAMGILRLAQRPQYPPDQDRRGEERNPGDNQSTCHRMPQWALSLLHSGQAG